MNKQVTRFLNRKSTKVILGLDHTLTPVQLQRLDYVFKKYGSPKKIEGWLSAIAFMIKYDLTNYCGRIRRLMNLPASPTKQALMLRYGKFWVDHFEKSANSRTRHFPNKISYWENKGLSREEATRQVHDVQKNRSALSPSSQKGASEYSIRCVGYWVRRGFSFDEAKKQVSRVQSKPRSPEVIEKWLATLDAKSPEEKELINRKKGHSIDSHLLRGYDLQTAVEMSIQYYKKRKDYSQSSQAFFVLLESLLNSSSVYYKTKNYEKQFGSYCVDFFDEISGTVIEYFGDFWHRNPRKYPAEFVAYGKSSTETWLADQKRLNYIGEQTLVKRIIIVWESDVSRNPHAEAEKIIKEINHGN